MRELDASWGRTLKVWWLLMWRGLLGSVVLGALAGAVVGFALGVLGSSPDTIEVAGSLAGGGVGALWAIVVTRMALKKQYRDFRLAIVERE